MPQTDVIIDYKGIIQKISSQINMIWEDLSVSADPSIQNEIKNIKQIEVSDEQNFVRKQDIVAEQGIVYIVVKFGVGSINFGSSVCPVTLLCMGTANKIKPVQLLMSVFASYWTTKNLMQDTLEVETNMLQVWNTPEVMSNFSEVNIEFRSLLRVSGNIVIGPAAIRLATLYYYYVEGGEKKSEPISIMSFQDEYSASLDSQPFGNTFGFVQSEVNFSTYTFSISTYLLKGRFANDMLAVRGFRHRNPTYMSDTSTFSPNKPVKLKLVFTNDYNNLAPQLETSSADDPIKGQAFFGEFKLVSSRIGQELAGLPILTVTFTH